MIKPPALQQLIEELTAEANDTTVGSDKRSSAKIFVDDDSVDNEDPILLNRRECELVFTSAATVQSVIEALGNPEGASIEIHDLDLSAEVLDALESNFSAVDEG